MEMHNIEQLTYDFAQARDTLGDRMNRLQADIDALKRRRLPGIKSALAKFAQAQNALQNAIDDNRRLFEKPKTTVFHGVKVGLQKGKGTIKVSDAEQTIKLIRRYLPEQADTLIKVTESPVKSALGQLSVAELKKIGCTVTAASDQVMVKPVDSELNKMIDMLIKDLEGFDLDDDQEAAA